MFIFAGTTRPQRPGELDNVDYKFLTVDEFMALEKSGNLLESGLYDGKFESDLHVKLNHILYIFCDKVFLPQNFDMYFFK